MLGEEVGVAGEAKEACCEEAALVVAIKGEAVITTEILLGLERLRCNAMVRIRG